MATLAVSEFTGVSNTYDKAKIDDTELYQCVNFDVTDKKSLRKRPGCSQLITFADTLPYKIRGRFKKDSTSIDQLVVTNASNMLRLWALNTGGTSGAYSSSTCTHGVQYVYKFWMVSPASVIKTWDGASISSIAGTPQGTMNLIYKDRMFLINTTATNGDENKVFYSNFYVTGNSTTEQFKAGSWSTANQFVSVAEGDGDKIVAIYEFNDIIFVFKQFSVWALYASSGSPDDWSLKRVSDSVGAYSKNAIQEIDGLLYFESSEGVYRTDGISFEEISAPIRSEFINRKIDASSYDDDSSIYWKTKYILFIYDRDKTIGKTWVYDAVNNSWVQYAWKDGTILPNSAVVIYDRSPNPVIFADWNSTKLFQFGNPVVTQDDFTNYTAWFRTKLYDFNDPFKMKRCNKALLIFRGQVITPQYGWYHDDGVLWGGLTTVAPGGNNVVDEEARIIAGPGYFRAVSLYYSDNGYGITSSFHGFSMDIMEKATPRRNTPQGII